jgi:hypothetical protein
VDVSISASRPTAAETSEPVARRGTAILPAAAFIVVEILLAAETIWVILLQEINPRSPAAAPLAILLSVALLANLGLVCGAAAAITASPFRRSNRVLSSSFASVCASEPGDVRPPAEPDDSAAGRAHPLEPPGLPASR